MICDLVKGETWFQAFSWKRIEFQYDHLCHNKLFNFIQRDCIPCTQGTNRAVRLCLTQSCILFSPSLSRSIDSKKWFSLQLSSLSPLVLKFLATLLWLFGHLMSTLQGYCRFSKRVHALSSVIIFHSHPETSNWVVEFGSWLNYAYSIPFLEWPNKLRNSVTL